MVEKATIELPDLGDFDEIEIIEVLIVPGDDIKVEDSVIVLESDKATMEIPSPYAGKVETVLVNVGDRISEGSQIATLKLASQPGSDQSEPDAAAISEAAVESAPESVGSSAASDPATDGSSPVAPTLAETVGTRQPPAIANTAGPMEKGVTIHASPAIRRHARELGVKLERVIGSGSKGRILKEDVTAFVKASLSEPTVSGGSGIAVAPMPDINFSAFGEVEAVALSRIQKISGAHLHRSWVSVPHVTQFDEADITELEAFRKSLSQEADKKGIKLTPLVFLMKAVVAALKAYPGFNASLDSSGERLILKKYFHIGVAVDTPNGLVVPVIRDVDQKGLYELAAELGTTAERARNGKLLPGDMQGGCFTISSLGGIGGTNFTPIINAPEVAILGVAKAKMQPVYQPDGSFQPGLILPLALSYDHRVIDGAQGARFTSYLSQVIADIRRVLL